MILLKWDHQNKKNSLTKAGLYQSVFLRARYAVNYRENRFMNFKQLWSNFPEKENIKARCYNKQPASSAPFSDYCAIMLSEALIVSGFSMNGFKGKKVLVS